MFNSHDPKAAARYSRRELGEATFLTPHFRVRELACRDGSDVFLIHPTLLVLLEEIRQSVDAPVVVNSCYRTPAYNRSIGGAVASYHIRGMAADIRVAGFTPEEVADFAVSLGAGGVGRYDRQGFTHVDVGPKRTWRG